VGPLFGLLLATLIKKGRRVKSEDGRINFLQKYTSIDFAEPDPLKAGSFLSRAGAAAYSDVTPTSSFNKIFLQSLKKSIFIFPFCFLGATPASSHNMATLGKEQEQVSGIYFVKTNKDFWNSFFGFFSIGFGFRVLY
jgi:hypothetical protein